jgi:ribosome recycling factor
MTRDILRETEEKMKKTCELLRRQFAGLRAGRATPALVERLEVDYYGTHTPLVQLASISAPEPRLLVIQPWDKAAAPAIEKAIQTSDLGVTPSRDGSVIRLSFPPLTEERRRDLTRTVRKMAEEERVAIRNLRREAIDAVKQRQKAGEISEDEARRAQEDVQELTDRYIAEIDRLAALKEQEILEV